MNNTSLRLIKFLLFICMLYIAGFNVLVSWLLQLGIDQILYHQLDFIKFGFFFLSSSILYIFISYLYGVLQEKCRLSLIYSMQKKLLKTYISCHQHLEVGEGLTRLLEDCDHVARRYIEITLPFIQLLITLILGLVYILFFALPLGLFVLCVLPLLYIQTKRQGQLVEKTFLGMAQAQEQLQTYLEAGYDSQVSLRVYHKQPYFMERFFSIFQQKENSSIKNAQHIANLVGNNERWVRLLEFISLVIGVWFVHLQWFTYGAMIGAWNALIGSVAWSLIDLPNLLATKRQQDVSQMRITEHLEWKSYIKPIQERMTIKDFHFAYGDKEILSGIDLTIQPKDRLVLMGESGCGKTTLIKCLLNLQDSELTTTLSAAYVPQAPLPLRLSIYDNLLLGKACDEQKIWCILEQLDLANWVKVLPQGLYTLLGQEITLSAGQAQRLAIARALLCDASMVVLDEPFSALDEENGKRVMKALENKGFILITHQLPSWLVNCRVLKMKEGKLYE